MSGRGYIVHNRTLYDTSNLPLLLMHYSESSDDGSSRKGGQLRNYDYIQYIYATEDKDLFVYIADPHKWYKEGEYSICVLDTDAVFEIVKDWHLRKDETILLKHFGIIK